MLNKPKPMTLTFFFLLLMSICKFAYATVYFSFDAESQTVGSVLTNPPFCMHPCGAGSGALGTIQSLGGTPQGSKYFQWTITANQDSHYNVINQPPGLPTSTNTLGKTYYMAYYFNFTRIGGLDIWHEGTSTQSADKGVELRGPGNSGQGLRWVTSMGQWDSLMRNQDHKFTMWLGNPSAHLNPSLEINDAIPPNQNGFTASNTPQLDYDRWHSVVFGIKIATDNTGSISLWINGVLVLQHNNVRTIQTSPVAIDNIEIGGTIAQPGYDAPAHTRKFDALLLTDNWQDIVNGGYLGSATSPSPPTNLRVQ